MKDSTNTALAGEQQTHADQAPDSERNIHVLAPDVAMRPVEATDNAAILAKLKAGEVLSPEDIAKLDAENTRIIESADQMILRAKEIKAEAAKVRGCKDGFMYMALLKSADLFMARSGFVSSVLPGASEAASAEVQIPSPAKLPQIGGTVADGLRDDVHGAVSTAVKVDHDLGNEEEVLTFFGIKNDTDGSKLVKDKKRIMDVLDEIALSRSDLKARQEYHKRRNSGALLKKIGSAGADAGRWVEGLFSPKATIYKQMKELQADDKIAAKKALEDDLEVINSGVDAIGEYVDKYYGVSFDLKGTDRKTIADFLDECMEVKDSIHYGTVQSFIGRKIRERKAQYHQEIAKIENDASYYENQVEMKQGSKYLRAKEWLFGKKVATATENTGITKTSNMRAVTKKERNRKAGWLVAAAAAFGLAVGGYGVVRSHNSKNDQIAQMAGKSGKKAVSGAAAEASGALEKALENKAKAELAAANAVAAPDNVAAIDPGKTEKVAEAAPAKHKLHGSTVYKYVSGKVAAASTARPKAAKSAVISKATAAIEKKAPEAKTNVVLDTKPLTSAEIELAMSSAENNILTYKKRIGLIYATGFVADKAADKAVEDKLVGNVNQVTARLNSLRTNENLKYLKIVYTQIEEALASLEKSSTAYRHAKAEQLARAVGHAEPDARDGLKKIETIKSLLGAKSSKFTIHHEVNSDVAPTGSSVTTIPYKVDLDGVAMSLAKIVDATRTGKDGLREHTPSFNLSPDVAAQYAADAKYYAGYLNFVEWYVRNRINDAKTVSFS